MSKTKQNVSRVYPGTTVGILRNIIVPKIPPDTVPGSPLRTSPPRFAHSDPLKMSCVGVTLSHRHEMRP